LQERRLGRARPGVPVPDALTLARQGAHSRGQCRRDLQLPLRVRVSAICWRAGFRGMGW